MKFAAAAAMLVLALAAAGCGSSSSQSASPGSASTTASAPTGKATKKTAKPSAAPTAHRKGCVPVSAHLLARLKHNMVLDGAKLEHTRAVASGLDPGLYFVSAVVQGGGAPKHAVATWATQSLAGRKPIYALDSFAALVSKFGGGVSVNPDFVGSAPGVYPSRVCAAGPGVAPAITAPPSGPIIHSPG